jgi:transcription elongation factor Elf1
MKIIDGFKKKYPDSQTLECSNCGSILLVYKKPYVKSNIQILICDVCKQDLEYYKNKAEKINEVNNADFNSIFGNIFNGGSK